MEFFIGAKTISEKSNVLVPELAECIVAVNDKVIAKLSKGMFRYAVELEVLIDSLPANLFQFIVFSHIAIKLLFVLSY